MQVQEAEIGTVPSSVTHIDRGLLISLLNAPLPQLSWKGKAC